MRQSFLTPVPIRELGRFMQGRPLDVRVKYYTHVNRGKEYPYASTRQNYPAPHRPTVTPLMQSPPADFADTFAAGAAA